MCVGYQFGIIVNSKAYGSWNLCLWRIKKLKMREDGGYSIFMIFEGKKEKMDKRPISRPNFKGAWINLNLALSTFQVHTRNVP
jgi:hypothetical protein